MSALEQTYLDAGPAPGVKQRLVVVGNGMAGARTVEEILARGGAEQFAITMFGDEPYGNYNRILLSHVLSGQETDDDIFLNTIDWYEENDITLYAGVRVTRVDRFAKVVFSDDGRTTPYDKLVVATGSRAFMPKMEGMYLPGSRGEDLLPGVFAFRTLDDTRAMIEYAQHDEHRKAVVVGGGLLGLEAARGLQRYGLDVEIVHAAQHVMNAQMGPEAADVVLRNLQRLGFTVHCGTYTTAVWGPDKVRGVRLKEGQEIACDLVVVAAGIRPNVDLAVASGFTVERAVVVDDQMRTQEDDDVYAVGECAQHRGQVYGLVAPLWEQAVVLADQITGANETSYYLGSRTATKLKVAGVEVASMGVAGPEKDTDEHIVYSEPQSGTYKSVVIRDDRLIGATLVGDSSKVAFLQQAFDRGLPLPERRAELLFDIGGAAGRGRRRGPARRHPGLQLQRRQQGGHLWRGRRRLPQRDGRHGHDPRRQGLRLLQEPRRPDRRVGRGRRGRGGPVGPLLRARHPDGQARADGGDPRARPEVGLGGLRGPRPGGRRGREVQDGTGVAAEDDVGRGRRRRARVAGSSTTASTPTSRRTAPSRSCRRCAAASRRPSSCAASPTSPRSTRCRWSSSPAASASTCSASARRTSPASGPTSTCRAGMRTASRCAR